MIANIQKPGPRRILMLYCAGDHWQALRPAIRQHLRFLDASPQPHQVMYHDMTHRLPHYLRRIAFDVVILHNTLLCYRWSNTIDAIRASMTWLKDYPALKIAIPQDEYDFSAVLDDWMDELDVDVICSNFDARLLPLLYPKMHRRARFLRCLTGYIDEATAGRFGKPMRPLAERPNDIVYRACHLPFWYGSQGQLKHEIASKVDKRARELGLKCDISTRPQDTITSDRWFDFLASSKTIIGCESGSSVHDPRGEIQAQIRTILAQNPTRCLAEVSALLPPGWDDHRFFAVGPRHLEAVFTRTCQVLVEGDYDGILEAGRHFISLRRDFGNLDEVLHMIKDHALLEVTAARAYEDICASKRYTYAAFAGQVNAEMNLAPERSRILPWGCLALWHRAADAVARGLKSWFGYERTVQIWTACPAPIRGCVRPIFRGLRSMLAGRASDESRTPSHARPANKNAA